MVYGTETHHHSHRRVFFDRKKHYGKGFGPAHRLCLYRHRGQCTEQSLFTALKTGFVNADGTIDETQLIGRLGEIKITFGVNAETGQSETYLDGRCVEREIRDMRVVGCCEPSGKNPGCAPRTCCATTGHGARKGNSNGRPRHRYGGVPRACNITYSIQSKKYCRKSKGFWRLAYLVKPIQPANLFPAIEIALSRFAEIQQLEQDLNNVKNSLEMRKTLDRAKGILMDAYNLTESEAYRRIQKYSMAKRKSIKEVAEAIIHAATK